MQNDCGTLTVSFPLAVDIRRPLNFVPSSSRIFLTRRETIKKPWLRLQNDPTLQRKPKGRPLIAHSGLRRLRPGMELNCEIVDAYCDLCQSDPAAAPVKILPTHFWQLVKGGGRSYLSADKLLYAHLVSILVLVAFWSKACLFDQVGGSVPKKGELTFGIKKAISQLSSLLFPINYNESHWLLAKMEFHVKRVTLYDSLRSMTGPKGRKTISKASLSSPSTTRSLSFPRAGPRRVFQSSEYCRFRQVG